MMHCTEQVTRDAVAAALGGLAGTKVRSNRDGHWTLEVGRRRIGVCLCGGNWLQLAEEIAKAATERRRVGTGERERPADWRRKDRRSAGERCGEGGPGVVAR